MPQLIFDIETVGQDFDSLDKTTQNNLTRWIKQEASDEEDYKRMLNALKDGLGFSPLTGEIISIGVLDYQKNKGAVYFQAPDQSIEDFEENGYKFKVMSEPEMLQKFWQGAIKYQEFITFNGRCFDVPYLIIRSAIHKIKPSKNLMANRYLGSQPFSAKHIDLLDQLTFYGSMRRKGSLHLFCRAFNIKSPKQDGISGNEVSDLFKKKEFIDIAKYNVGDLIATRELYEYWRDYVRF